MMYIKVFAETRAKKDSLIENSKDHFKISVKEKPENNMANKKIIQILATHFNVSVRKIRIINGHHHPHKLLVIEDGL